MGLKAWAMFVPDRIDWKAERDRIDLAAVATRLLGPAPGRRGERGRKLWWSCPLDTHEDDNPSFCVVPGKVWWQCYGCGEKGDAATLVMRLEGLSFPKAVEALVGGHDIPHAARSRPVTKPAPVARPEPMGREIHDLVAEAEQRLWTAEGAEALAYIAGRGLAETTIRATRLGVTGMGITIPWFDGPDLMMVNVRRTDGSDPRYMALRGSHRGGLYPGTHAIVPGLPVVIVEGEFDAMLLGQELTGLAGVVTLGGASGRPDSTIRGRMLQAFPRIVATDADEAGDKAAEAWPESYRRVRPPGAFKDWTEAKLGGMNLRRWWSDRLAGDEAPALFSWDELAALRWGPSADDPDPGIVHDRPDRGQMLVTLESRKTGGQSS